MPCYVIHNVVAKEIKNTLDKDTQQFLNINKQAFAMGAQGPDILFYLKFKKYPKNKLGNFIHRKFKTFEIFKNSADFIKETKSDVQKAFMIGQLCHYAIDANIHPYVYHREKDLPKFYNKAALKHIHTILESGIDYLFIKDYLKVHPQKYKGYQCLTCDYDTKMEIAQIFSNVYAPTYDMTLSIDDGIKSITLMRRFLTFCHDPSGLRYKFLRLGECLISDSRLASVFVRPQTYNEDENWMNFKRIPYPKYFGEEIETLNLTVYEMLDNAREEAKKLIENFIDYINGKKDLDKKLYYKTFRGELIDKKLLTEK